VEGDAVATAPAPAPAPAKNPRRGRVTPAATGEYEVRLIITEAEHAEFVRAQALLGHAVPLGDPALVYARAMKHYLAHLEKQRLGAKPGGAVEGKPGSKSIPKALRRFVWERDGGRCAFVSADGHRCGETMRVEVDHIIPLALGGKSTAENLRLLCAAHNQHEARRVLTGERVQHRREIAHRERAKAKAAAQASRERQQARDRAAAEEASAQAKARAEARRARRDDVCAALRGLRHSAPEARRGAEVADAMPDDATTEACLKAALAELARPLLMRCERMARCTT
jgi:5-methylcytosine-specific restriction endonuclease McrA